MGERFHIGFLLSLRTLHIMRIVGPTRQTWACRGTIGGAGRAGRAGASAGEASVAGFFQLYFGFKALLLSAPILFDLFLSSGAFSFGDKLKYSLRSILFESSHFLMQSPIPSIHGALNNVPTTLLVPDYLSEGTMAFYTINCLVFFFFLRT